MIDRRSLLGGLAIGLGRFSGARAQAKATATFGSFSGSVKSEWEKDGRHMKLLAPFSYTDGKGTAWSVPKFATVDGASIPSPLWSVIGGPFEGKYRDASVVHDWFCDVRTRPWERVHRMFYEGMRASGVPDSQARLLYFGVYVGGPRWDSQAIANNQLAVGKEVAQLSADMTGGPPAFVACDRSSNYCRTVFRPEAVHKGGIEVADDGFPDKSWQWTLASPEQAGFVSYAPKVSVKLQPEDIAPPVSDPAQIKTTAERLARSGLSLDDAVYRFNAQTDLEARMRTRRVTK